MLTGKNIVLAVTGSIAAYKIANLASMLKKLNADITVLMTRNATHFIHPITFETLTGNKCLIDTFDRNFQYNVEHVSVAKKADVVLIAPASANVIGKIACGIADDMLTTTVMACNCKKIVSPAMNTQMFENPIVQDNIRRLKKFGYEIIEPDSGYLACGDNGPGKMPSEQILLQYILRECAKKKDMVGLRVMVTAGPTREKIDPVRFISNHSTGKMGYAIARNCMLRGAEVTLITGKVDLQPPMFVNTISVDSAEEMLEAVLAQYEQQDIVVKAAAVADYRPVNPSDEKVKKKEGELSIALEKTQDILKTLGEHKSHQYLCGFSMETQNMLANSKTKLQSKNVDMIVANNLKTAGAGFGTDTNVVTIITPDEVKELSIMSKDDVAENIINEILRRRKI